MALRYFRSTGTNWGTAGDWSSTPSPTYTAGAVPLVTDDVVFEAASANCIVNASARVCKSINFTLYTNTITMTFGITVSGNVTLSAGMTILGTGNLTINATSTYTSNGKTFPNTLSLDAVAVTLGDNSTIQNFLHNTLSCSINNNTLTVLGNFTGGFYTIGGTATIDCNGSGTISSNNGEIQTNFTISGNYIITGNIKYGVRTLTATIGSTITDSGSNLSLLNCTWVSNNKSWGNLNITGTITMTGNATVKNLLLTNLTSVINSISTLYVTGNLSQGIYPVSGTATIELSGSNNITWAGSSAGISNNLTINKTGTVTLTGTIIWGASGRTLTFTSGTILPGTSTFSSAAGTTYNIINSLGFSLNNWSPAVGTHTINTNPLVVNGTLLLAGTTTFAGTRGFTCNNLTCTLAASIITFQNINANPLAEYIVNGVLTLIGTLANRITLQAAGSAIFNGTINPVGQLNYLSGTIPSIGMTLSQNTGVSPVGLIGLLPNRPVITGGTSPTFTITPNATTVIGASFSMRAGYKAKFTLTNGTGSQNIAYTTTQDIDSNSGATITSFGSNGDDINNTTISLFRTLNWGPLIAPSGSVYYTFVN